MIRVTTNIGEVTGRMTAKLKEAVKQDGILKDKAVRAVLSTLAAEMKKRIHEEGKKSDGSQIGTYSNPYLSKRKKFNRSETKVVLSLTRQMESDFSIVGSDPIKTQTGYALGFKNNAKPEVKKPSMKKNKSGKPKKEAKPEKVVSNAQKAEWMEELYGDIYKPTKQETENIGKNYKFYVQKVVRELNKK